MKDILDAISNVGFPIVCVILLAMIYVNLYTTLHNELENLSNKIEQNTQTMIHLIDKLDSHDDVLSNIDNEINGKNGENQQ